MQGIPHHQAARATPHDVGSLTHPPEEGSRGRSSRVEGECSSGSRALADKSTPPTSLATTRSSGQQQA